MSRETNINTGDALLAVENAQLRARVAELEYALNEEPAARHVLFAAIFAAPDQKLRIPGYAMMQNLKDYALLRWRDIVDDSVIYGVEPRGAQP